MNIFRAHSVDSNASYFQNLSGKRALVTGGGRGIGLEMVKNLASMGAQVIMLCRSEGSAKEAMTELHTSIIRSDLVTYEICDFSRLNNILQFCQLFAKTHNSLDLLVNTLSVINDELEFSEDGYEITLQINFLSVFYLINGLMPLLLKSSQLSRIVLMSSDIHHFGHVDMSDPFGRPKGNYSPISVYSNTKLMIVLLMKQLVKMVNPEKILVVCGECLQPPYPMKKKLSILTNSTFISQFKNYFSQSKNVKSIRVLLHCCTDLEIQHWNGFYVSKKLRVKDSSFESYNLDLASSLWRSCEEACGFRHKTLNSMYFTHDFFYHI